MRGQGSDDVIVVGAAPTRLTIEVSDIDVSDEGVTHSTRDSKTWNPRYVVGTDGPCFAVRRAFGVEHARTQATTSQ